MDFTLPEIPTPKQDDPEDVSWALSTAEAMWSRGDHAEAIKWIRRGAEAASEAEADDRALELAKAAADLASMIVRMSHSGENTSEEPPPPPPPPGPPGSLRAPQYIPQSVPPPPGFSPAPPPVSLASVASGSPASVPPPVTARSAPPPPMTSSQPRGSVAPAAHPSQAPPAQRVSVAPSAGAPRAAVNASNAGNASNQAQRAPRPLQASRGPERAQSTGRGVLSAQTAQPAQTGKESRRRRSSASLDEDARTENGGAEKLADRVERAALEAMRVDFRKTSADVAIPDFPQESQESLEPPSDAQEQQQEARVEDSPSTQDDPLARTSEHRDQDARHEQNSVDSTDNGNDDGETTRAMTGNPASNLANAANNPPPVVRKRRKSKSNEMRPRSSSATDEWDSNPTQSLSRAELDSITNEHSLVPPRSRNAADGTGSANARSKSPSTHPGSNASGASSASNASNSSRSASNHPPLHNHEEHAQPIIASQAVRVVLWRDSDGVHVAPAGTVVSAIKVDAILVALDPTADLSNWLDPRRVR